jgi:hypothetical protein
MDPRIIYQNIHMAIAEFERSLRDGACARVVKIRGNEIRPSSRSADIFDRFVSALGIASYNQNVEAQLR